VKAAAEWAVFFSRLCFGRRDDGGCRAVAGLLMLCSRRPANAGGARRRDARGLPVFAPTRDDAIGVYYMLWIQYDMSGATIAMREGDGWRCAERRLLWRVWISISGRHVV
jgi:hypothetical protein